MTVTRPGRDFTEVRVDAGADPQAVLRAAMAKGDDVLRFEVADPSLEEVFVERVGALDVEEKTAGGSGGAVMSAISNIGAVARREYTVRIRTRSFLVGTVILLLVASLVIAFLPVIIREIDQGTQTRIAVHVAATDVPGDPATTLGTLLNASDRHGWLRGQSDARFRRHPVPDLAAARQAAVTGATTRPSSRSTARLRRRPRLHALHERQRGAAARQGSSGRHRPTIAVGDRLSRLGIAPTDQAGIFAPTTFSVEWPDPARIGPTRGTTEMVGQDMLAFGMTLLIFMMIILYGTWIAMSVVEEKSSRVMEVILNAATPFQLLTGKVLGVGAVALTQYVALLLTGAVALLVQGPIDTALFGATADAALPQGLTIELLLLFGVYGVLGFLLFAVLYAAAGSLVSRQEDVNSIVMPMTLVVDGRLHGRRVCGRWASSTSRRAGSSPCPRCRS